MIPLRFLALLKKPHAPYQKSRYTAMALARQFAVLLKFIIKVQLQNNDLQIGPHDHNASHWFRTMYAARRIAITFIYQEQELL